ncbi:chloride channel protein 2-like protein [Dinothrombium tinctorium]|uniref:Chloride channel protein 2-like protein n=1 Tax=Dinothrombium tinctorium TaxID=1965070 RepID=A0A3S4QSE3_9ACAR|nr:chloride channel protein 2-like protein [Dinothrombium tinctorium]RWS07168.1 chloride channel protein 2-like protein [Dinothrombium tinctorium]RWS07390.1 chloride channel protein 2-like protein [Dinothrombium tinctorium]
MERKGSALGYEHTLMYGHYREDLGQFARKTAKKIRDHRKNEEQVLAKKGLKKYKSAWKRKLRDYFSIFWNYTFNRIGEDWVFLALLGIIMAFLSFLMDRVIELCSETRMRLYNDLTGNNLFLKYLSWTLTPICLILFASGFTHIVAPQAVGSGIPEMKTILRGVVLKEYLTFRTLVAKMVGLTFTLGSGLPLGKEGPFVHIASIVATLLSQLVTSFQGIYENESRTVEMLAAACAVGVAATFYAPIGGVLFSIEVTSVFFAVRNYWRGFFAACCGATIWRLLGFWAHDDGITALFRTSFSSDFPFDPQELFVFAFIGAVCGFAGAGYVSFHRKIPQYVHLSVTTLLSFSRFLYPGLVTFIVTSFAFPPFLGKYMASTVSGHKVVLQFFSNKTWGIDNPDVETQQILKDWTTNHSNFYIHLTFYIFMLWWTSTLASTIPVPSGLFIPVFKMGAAFGRLVGEIMAFLCPNGIPFGESTIPIVPGGYAVVGAAAFAGAVTHTISTTVMVFELTGQMSHILPVIIAVLVANAVAQALKPSIYDSIIEIKKLPFLPSIMSTNSVAYNIKAEDIMIKDVVYVWRKCTYRDIQNVLKSHPQIQSFPLVESPRSMILLGSVRRDELSELLSKHLGREKRLQEVQRRYSIQETIRYTTFPSATSSSKNSLDGSEPETSGSRRPSRFEVTPIFNQQDSSTRNISPPPSPKLNQKAPSPKTPVKSILKQTVNFTYSPHSTLSHDSRLRNAFEAIFVKSQKLQDANANKSKVANAVSNSVPSTPTIQRRVQLPKERVIDMSPEEQLAWEDEQLNRIVDLSSVQVDPAPFQLVEHTSLMKVHSLFSMLQLNHSYVTSMGRLVGVVALKDIRIAIEKMHAGTLVPQPKPQNTFPESDPQYEDSMTSTATSESIDPPEAITRTETV